MLFTPNGYPKIRLSYLHKNINGETLLHETIDEERIAYQRIPNILMFSINDMGSSKTIMYDMGNDIVLQDDSYIMVNFEVLEVDPDKELVFVGTLCKTDIEDEVYNIKLAGRLLRSSNLESLPYLTLPER
ncbi:hypothetical protein K3G39_20105 [Pontibacter sp. HSC-14F20]|uniref:hypothetical protein n=1 Tax=Pontibacter sp. HSC-14F20 TaxID=2864136 RepID=UPI001C72B2EB|nr:hypothetical protein [Pontibacter sp. HSC-14F20]MBX0335541.1 hypothetical protein [Pontibacter sp. HSC-14F20]